MQSAADALALAGAAELDRKPADPATGRPGAIARATAAINNLLSNQLFGITLNLSVSGFPDVVGASHDERSDLL